jgi:hypothetical protein
MNAITMYEVTTILSSGQAPRQVVSKINVTSYDKETQTIKFTDSNGFDGYGSVHDFYNTEEDALTSIGD